MKMAYGDKRDYRKIDIFLRRPGCVLDYVGSTTWAKNCREARERYAVAHGQAASDLLAYYDKRER
jgi:hypothetical protein